MAQSGYVVGCELARASIAPAGWQPTRYDSKTKDLAPGSPSPATGNQVSPVKEQLRRSPPREQRDPRNSSALAASCQRSS